MNVNDLADLVPRLSYRFRSLDEHFAFAELKLGRVHINGIHNDFDAGTQIASPLGPRLLADDGVPKIIAAHGRDSASLL